MLRVWQVGEGQSLISRALWPHLDVPRAGVTTVCLIDKEIAAQTG